MHQFAVLTLCYVAEGDDLLRELPEDLNVDHLGRPVRLLLAYAACQFEYVVDVRHLLVRDDEHVVGGFELSEVAEDDRDDGVQVAL